MIVWISSSGICWIAADSRACSGPGTGLSLAPTAACSTAESPLTLHLARSEATPYKELLVGIA